MSLREFHRYQDGVRWRLVPGGVEIEGTGIERTRGSPSTVTRVWEDFSSDINRVARARRVPCPLIVATICTESSGHADAARLEPGYVSDEETPGRVSIGLMQTLISTARAVMGWKVGRGWLLTPGNSIEAGAGYIQQQARVTQLDPPLVAAAYNAGGLYYQNGATNRWKLRQYPIGTSAHLDRFVRFFNDAVFVLQTHTVRPSVGVEALLEGAAAPAATPSGAPSRPAAASTPAPATASDGGRTNAPITVDFAEHARPEDVTPYSREVLEDVLRAARLRRALISSTSRSPEDQARVMYDNLEREGVTAQRALYARPGNRVIDVYERSRAAGKTPVQIKEDMARKIREIGPTNVSRHASDPHVLNVFDVAPSSIRNRRGFEVAVRAESRISYFLTPPRDPGYHLEIPQPTA